MRQSFFATPARTGSLPFKAKTPRPSLYNFSLSPLLPPSEQSLQLRLRLCFCNRSLQAVVLKLIELRSLYQLSVSSLENRINLPLKKENNGVWWRSGGVAAAGGWPAGDLWAAGAADGSHRR